MDNDNNVVPSANEIEQYYSGSSDDTFLPLADFLTLLSLAFIYAALIFARPSLETSSPGVAVNAAARGGPGMPLSTYHGYVSVLGTGDRIGIRVIAPGDEPIREWTFTVKNLDVEKQVSVVLGIFADQPRVDGIGFYLPSTEKRPEVHWLFNEMWSAADDRYVVGVVH